MNMLRSAAPWISALALLGAGTAQATEGGGSTYNPGVENFLVGAAPPPGFYVLEYLTHYRASDFNDNNGNSAVPGFKLRATAAATRFVWSTPTQVAGGNLVMHAIVPLVNLSVTVPGAFSQSKTGLGDCPCGPASASTRAGRGLGPCVPASDGGKLRNRRASASVSPRFACAQLAAMMSSRSP